MTEAHEAHHPRATHLLLSVPAGSVPPPGKLLWAGDLWLAGYQLQEDGGVADAIVTLIDGTDAGGVPISPRTVVTLGTSKTVMLGGHLLAVRTGVFVKVEQGSVNGVIYAADR